MKRQRQEISNQNNPKRQKTNDMLEQQNYLFEMKILQMLQSKDVDALTAALAKVMKLDLRWREIGYSGGAVIAESLKSNQSLTELYLERNKIGASDLGAAAIGEALKINQSLTRLDLHDNQIGDEGAAAIAESLKSNQTLRKLGLQWNKIGASGGAAIANALAINNGLTQLELAGNQIGDEGAADIAEALKSNNTLTQLNLSSNQIGASGGVVIAESLKTNNTLIQLDIRYNQIKTEEMTKISNHLKINLHIKHAKEELTPKYLLMREFVVQQEEQKDSDLPATIPQIQLDIINTIFIHCIDICGDASDNVL